MGKENSGIEYELTPTRQKGKLIVPNEGANELAKATAHLINNFNNSSKKVLDMFCNGLSKLGEPIGEIIKGKTAAIELANQSIYMKLAVTKETNMRKLIAYSVEEFDKKVKEGQEIPNHLIETDNLLLIQENASTTSNEEFLKLWAKIYTEEACKPNTVSKKTIKLLETLDSRLVEILEKEIFPYCDENGYYWRKTNDISKVLLIQDYGLIDAKDINTYCIVPKEPSTSRINTTNTLHVYPGYGFSPSSKFVLTKSGLEIKKILKISPKRKHLQEIFEVIANSSKYWHLIHNKDIKYIKKPLQDELFIITGKNGNVIYPKDSKFKTLKQFKESALRNIVEIKENDK